MPYARSYAKILFSWDELSHLKPTKTGFKFYKRLEEPRPFRSFWKLHMSSRYSGEFHVEREDLARVKGLLARHDTPILEPSAPNQIRPESGPRTR
jgi:hypothetical protein